ncbi:hypothetical protein IAI10_06480 [Clostridium sp. 19966]|uniref:hypothetical protein n=1 Tax=Clostridium sp. 19966 TaxID=2768166 RepID=UPI0028DDC728|nr:hypothetical protein [Clostridium sp. 19966]MDT8716297.1 hypothetical protein [Clostridium sp. 19966]
MLVAIIFYIMLNIAYFAISNGININLREKDEIEAPKGLFNEYALEYKTTLR